MTLNLQPFPAVRPGPGAAPGDGTTTTAPAADAADPDAGLGTLRTPQGNLPLREVDLHARVTGLLARVELSQAFHNPFAEPLEATYVFPMPERAAVTGLRMEADGHTVVARLQERGRARADYERALAEGRRASITEQERPDVFTMRVGNILPGEQVVVRLSLVQPLPYADGEAELRFPLVVAPRYVPGEVLPGQPVGSGWAPDTTSVPDASRITPPVLLPGFPNPVRLSIEVDIDPAGLELAAVRSSLHAVVQEGNHISVRPGERVDRDFILRLGYGPERATATALSVEDGTFRLTALPPVPPVPPRPRDVVLLLDRSGSMSGWKMVAARRAAARIVDTLTGRDRFAVLSFDSVVERPDGQPAGLVAGGDRERFRAVEHLARLEARGGTELLAPLREAVALLSAGSAAAGGARDAAGDAAQGSAGDSAQGAPPGPAAERDRVLVLVTDGQVGNEDQILHEVSAALAPIRVHVVGIDRAVNAGFLARLAAAGGGRCELVESQDRLDEAAERIHRRIAAPLLTGVRVEAAGGGGIDAATVAPQLAPDLFPGVPLVLTGRCEPGLDRLRVTARTADGQDWSVTVPAATARPADGDGPAPLTAMWARAHLRDLEDAYAAYPADPQQLERRIVATSLRHGVLCRFTAFVATDQPVVAGGAPGHRVTQPVEPASGWDLLDVPPPAADAALPRVRLAAAPASAPPVAPMAAPGIAPGGLGAAAGGPVGGAPASARFGASVSARFGGAVRRTLARPTRPAVPGEGGSGEPPSPGVAAAELRQRLERELAGLHAGHGLAAPARCALLADLGTRLRVLAAELRDVAAELRDPAAEPPDDAVPAAVVDRLDRVVVALRGCDADTPPDPARLEALWGEAEESLAAAVRALAAAVRAPAAVTPPPAPAERPDPPDGRPRAEPGDGPREGFWRRG